VSPARPLRRARRLRLRCGLGWRCVVVGIARGQANDVGVPHATNRAATNAVFLAARVRILGLVGSGTRPRLLVEWCDRLSCGAETCRDMAACAVADPSDAQMKTATPSRKSRRLPTRSEGRPTVIGNDAKTSE
jgi:hypothetical protein